jgi:iduronate 2-sulfatase
MKTHLEESIVEPCREETPHEQLQETTTMKYILVLALGILPSFVVQPHAFADAPRPNVLFIASDDMRPWLGCYGHPQAKTPNLDRLAASGVRFHSAHVQYAICMASRTSMLSGCRPDEAGRQWYIGPGKAIPQMPHHVSIRALRPDIVSLPQHLRKQGWHTVSIGKIGHDWDRDGFDELRFGPDEGMLGYYELPESVAKIKDKSLKLPPRGIPYEAADLPDAQYNDGEMALDAVKKLKALKAAGKPFFLGIGFWRPHMPLVCPKKYWDMYPASEVVLPTNVTQPADVGPLARFSGPSGVNWENYRLPEKKDGSLDEANMREMIRGYLACISFVDTQAGIVLDALKAEGLDRNTIVIFWGDHGYHLGEHGEWSKVTNYEEATRVPLIIRDPTAPRGGAVVEQPVETLDLFPTLCDLLGLPAPAHLEGESLRPLLRGEPGRKKDLAISVMQRNAAHSFSLGKGGRWDAVGWSLRTATHRFNLWLDHKTKAPVQREFFDLTADPGENTNLANDPVHTAAMRVLEERLMKEIILPHRQIQSTLRRGTTAAESPSSKPKDSVEQKKK